MNLSRILVGGSLCVVVQAVAFKWCAPHASPPAKAQGTNLRGLMLLQMLRDDCPLERCPTSLLCQSDKEPPWQRGALLQAQYLRFLG